MTTWLVRFTVGEWKVCRAFRTPADAWAFREHIIRVYNAKADAVEQKTYERNR
jgi:hypothetical protein